MVYFWVRSKHEQDTANRHEEILAGLAVPHSRFKVADSAHMIGHSVMWVYRFTR
jgi:hypothetical protein